jgi:nucleotide-binding universal stress UspA family protein
MLSPSCPNSKRSEANKSQQIEALKGAYEMQVASKRVSLENVLYATDLSRNSTEALPYALSIARKYESTIFAVHVISLSPFQASSPTLALQAISSQAVREASEAMAKLEPQLKAIPHEVLIRKGDIWNELSAIIDNKGIDLVVVGTHGRTGVSKLLTGSVAEKIFRQAPCPVLTVGPNVSGEPDSIVDMRTILYPIDFTSESLAAAPYAISLAQENGARLYLLHVTPSPVNASVEASLTTRLRTLVPPEARLWCEPKPYVESGDAAQKILDFAEELDADLIVLGTKHVARFAGAATHLGMATAYKVVSQAVCPVLTVRGSV